MPPYYDPRYDYYESDEADMDEVVAHETRAKTRGTWLLVILIILLALWAIGDMGHDYTPQNTGRGCAYDACQDAMGVWHIP